MSDYAGEVRKHRRLAILRHLEACPEYTANASLLQSVLTAVGISSTRDQVVTEIVWLTENGFATHIDHGDFMVVVATQRGAEIARGLATHPEIQRPRPRL